MDLEPLDLNGRRTQVAVGGDGPPLLYLHSAAGESIAWMDLLTGLADEHTVHAPLQPGFFESEGLEQIRDIEDLTYHYLALIDARGWERIDVMGCSVGGWIALELAARHPERIGRLVLAASAGIRIPDVPMADMFRITVGQEERARELLFHDPTHPLAAVALPSFSDLPEEQLGAFIKAMAATAKVAWNPYMHNPRLEGLLGRISAETLIVWGEDDRMIPLAYGERLTELIPGARLETIPECGHAIWLERPQPLLELARAHLAAPAGVP
jgi:pimeloyl-ACP methyl ester carboxylesterase